MRLPWALLLVAAAGCSSGPSGSDAGPPDLSVVDLAGADHASEDLAQSDFAGVDLPAPDLTVLPDLVFADFSPSPVIVMPLAGVTVSTIAGSSVAGSMDGAGAVATFDNPTGIAFEPAGSLLVADYDGGRIRRVQTDGTTSTLLQGQNGFALPFGVAVLSDGTIVAQTDADTTGVKSPTSGTLWKVSQAGVASAILTGQGRPRGLFPTSATQLAVADRQLETVGLFDVGTKTLTSLAGAASMAGWLDAKGTAARFDDPLGVALLPDGSLAVADRNNNRIRQVAADGTVTTLAGDGVPGIIDGMAAMARFGGPRAVAADAAGDLFVCDHDNYRIRRIDAAGNVVTVAGDGTAGWMDGDGTVARFYGIEGIVATSDGKTLYVTDGNSGDGSGHHRIRKLALP